MILSRNVFNHSCYINKTAFRRLMNYFVYEKIELYIHEHTQSKLYTYTYTYK